MKKTAFILGVLFLAASVILIAATLAANFLVPLSFASSTKIFLPGTTPAAMGQEAAKISTQSTRLEVVRALNLEEAWGKKFKRPGKLPPVECSALLNSMVLIAIPSGSAIFEIRVTSQDAEEAAAIANKLTELYMRSTPAAKILEQAQPNSRPIRSKRINLMIGLITSAISAANGLVLLLVARRSRTPDPSAM